MVRTWHTRGIGLRPVPLLAQEAWDDECDQDKHEQGDDHLVASLLPVRQFGGDLFQVLRYIVKFVRVIDVVL